MEPSYQIRSLEQYHHDYARSLQDPEGFWADVARSFHWRQPWNRVLQWDFQGPKVQWFQGAKLNITENCLDRHLALKANQPAIIWEPNDPSEANRILTYQELHLKVCQFSHVLRNNGVRKGDRVDVGRTDAATKERATIEAYLPAPMSDEDVQKDVAEEVANAAAAGARGGKTMSSEVKAVRERVGASADSGKIAALG